MNKQEINKILEKEVSKSSKMLELYEGGLEVGEIAKLLGVRYNFSYNVISRKAMVEGKKVRTSKNKGEVKNSVIEKIKEGKTNKEISEELHVNYNYVWSIRKEFEIKERSQEFVTEE